MDALCRVLDQIRIQQQAKHDNQMANVMLLFGTGGHSSEMLMLMCNAKLAERLRANDFASLTCVISDDDSLIEDKINHELRHVTNLDNIKTIRLKRARRVGQSYITAVWTTFAGILSSIHMIASHRPHICITNGPAISVITILAIRLLNLLTINRYKCEVLYIESFCRTKTLSLSGKIIYNLRLADKFYVQWPYLQHRYHRALYKGLLV